jgi:cell division septal protein FtsQ
MPPVSTPADKRFRRSHVKPSGRRRSRLRQAWLILRVLALTGLAGYGAWRGVSLVAHSQALQVAHITVTGLQRLSPGEVLALLEGLRGRNILGVDLLEWQARLLASPWVDEVTLRRVLPSTIEVRVHERRPMAVGRIGNGLYLIDAQGVVMDEFGPAYADLDLPVVDGVAGRVDGRTVVDPARAALAARVIAALAARPDPRPRVSQIDVSHPHDAVVMLEGDTTLLRLGDEDFAERLQQYVDLGAALRERVAAIDYVDLRFPERLYVRPARGSAMAPVSRQAHR